MAIENPDDGIDRVARPDRAGIGEIRSNMLAEFLRRMPPGRHRGGIETRIEASPDQKRQLRPEMGGQFHGQAVA